MDFALDRPEVGEAGRSVSGSLHLPSTPIPGIGVGGMVSYWTRGEANSLLVAPELRASLGRAELRGTYRLYQTRGSYGALDSHFVDGSVTLPFGGGTYLRVMASNQWGGDLASTRLSASLWKGF